MAGSKHNIHRVAVLLFFLAAVVLTFAQSADEVSRPSSNAMQNYDVSTVSVGMHTGDLSVRLPLFTLPGLGVDLPVALCFSGAGITHQSEASQFGLGWSVSIGGAITATIRGDDDFKITSEADVPWQYDKDYIDKAYQKDKYCKHDSSYRLTSRSSGVLVNPSIHSSVGYTPLSDTNHPRLMAYPVVTEKPQNTPNGPAVCYTEVEEIYRLQGGGMSGRKINRFNMVKVAPPVNLFYMNHKIGGTETDSHYMFYIKNNIYGKEKGYPDGMKGLEEQNYQYVAYPVGDFLCHTVSTGNLREEITFDSQDRPISKTLHEYTYSYSNSKYGYIPVNAIDPDGKSTWVTNASNGYYNIIGGNLLDNDLNIYLCERDGIGRLIKLRSIGITTSITSFYDSDNETWATNQMININDYSGETFFGNIKKDNPSLIEYMYNARTKKYYDFKYSNGTENNKDDGKPMYRGMPFGKNEKGQNIYTSARDIGNIIAGYIAGSHGHEWQSARLAFDTYQSLSSKMLTTEGISTYNAELYGWHLGSKSPRATIIFKWFNIFGNPIKWLNDPKYK